MAEVHPTATSTDFSTQHYYAAQIFAEEAASLESEFQGEEREPGTYTKHQAFVSGAVLFAVAFLEAYIKALQRTPIGVVQPIRGTVLAASGAVRALMVGVRRC